MARNVVPEDELRKALVALKAEKPTLGVAKIHNLLLEANPTWAVSEKRVRKILQSEGLVATEKENGTANGAPAIHPSSRLNKSLDVEKWSSKVKVHYYNAVKGKGLVATEKISEGEVLWKEDPFVLAPEWDIYDLKVSSRACGFCSTPLGDHSPLHLPCQASSSATPCPTMFCNRLCRMHAEKVHPLLCPARNPASIPLLAFARNAQWLALHALTQCTSKLLLSAQRDDGSLDDDLQVVQGLAELGMEERFKALRDQGVEPDRENWRKAYGLYQQAFKEPKTVGEQKKLAKILKKPISEIMDKDLFDYDAFLRGLGRMSLNIEAHGGLYKLHSHLNHSCAPNVSVRHLDRRNALSRITVIARTAIEPGEELLITYTDPESNFRERRRRLSEWGFGPCQCERCLAEEKEAKESGTNTEEADELADHLRAGLGLV
ncbi:hypothetical protein HYDPIDRAFT_97759 [Hydnomerulius pinastri MD-312]|uniref:Histone-lysine N-methyltransferase SET5 n=1 Tax=Hydnomerulius pinastri MD-312 TaxID=994086 RepID=A0A0C9V5Q3_9AGAM|nr:hypothetical protein HYDPIDRAFT_97759 [Hydnomerulius pinastri MD-312]